MSHNFWPVIASQSLQHPSQSLINHKITAAAQYGMRGVEIFFDDIQTLADRSISKPHLLADRFEPKPPSSAFPGSTAEQERCLAVASQIRQWCLDTTPQLKVLCLQPFKFFDGHLEHEAEEKFAQLHYWIHLAKRLGTDLIQIPSNFLAADQCTGDRDTIVHQLRTVAETGAKQLPPIRFAYEALCWGTYTDTWDAAWDIVQAVDMPNFGTCLDTFNIAGRVFADPTRPDGKNSTSGADMARCLQQLNSTFSVPSNLARLFYVELCDGERLSTPLGDDHPWTQADPSQPARMTWSRNARLFPFETDTGEAQQQRRNVGYLPVTQILDVLLDVGYEGPLSFEVFNRSLSQPGAATMMIHGVRARTAWERTKVYIDRYLSGQQDATESSAELHDHDDDDRMSLDQRSVQVVSLADTQSGFGISPRL